MKQAIKLTILFSLALTCGSQEFHAAESAGDTPTVIGLLLPPEEAEAASLRQGAQMGVDCANASSKGKIDLLIRGRIGQWGADGEEAGKMVIDESVIGLIAPPGGAPSHLALQVSGRTATPVVSLCSDSSVTKAGIPWMVRIVPETGDEARTIFSTFKTAGSERPFCWAALVPPERAGREAGKDLAKAAMASGSLLREPVIVPLTDFERDAAIKTLLHAKPDGVFVWLDPAIAGTAVKKLRSSGFTGYLAGQGRLACDAFFTSAGSDAEGFIMPSPVRDPASHREFASFADDYRKRFGAAPDFTAAVAFDAARLLIDLAGKADGRPLHQAFPVKHELSGASGHLKFDTTGNRIISLELQCVRSGHLVPFKAQKAKL